VNRFFDSLIQARRGLVFALAVAAIVALTMPDGRASTIRTRFAPPIPRVRSSPFAAARVGVAVPARVPEAFPSPGTLLVEQSFADDKTPPNAFPYVDQTCLTAGTKAIKTSVPPCGSLAPRDPNGSGVLENVNLDHNTASWVSYAKPFSTALGIQVSFTIYSWGGNGADGQLLFFTDASKGPPENVGQSGGEMGYTGGGSGGPAGLDYAYLGIAFDEYGVFSLDSPASGLNGGPGQIPETIAVRGSAGTGYYYLGGALNANGQPASLPFDWNAVGAEKRPATGPTVFVTLTPTGYLSCAVDLHDGNGFITYYAQSIVGVHGEPAVPASVYIGVTGSNGSADDRHQIGDLYIWSM
jgi:hypothetical protein